MRHLLRRFILAKLTTAGQPPTRVLQELVASLQVFMQLRKIRVSAQHLVHVYLVGKVVEVTLTQVLRAQLHLPVVARHARLTTCVHLLLLLHRLKVLVRSWHLAGKGSGPALRHDGGIDGPRRKVHHLPALHAHHLLLRRCEHALLNATVAAFQLGLVVHHLRVRHILVRHRLLHRHPCSVEPLHLALARNVLRIAPLRALSISLVALGSLSILLLFFA